MHQLLGSTGPRTKFHWTTNPEQADTLAWLFEPTASVDHIRLDQVWGGFHLERACNNQSNLLRLRPLSQVRVSLHTQVGHLQVLLARRCHTCLKNVRNSWQDVSYFHQAASDFSITCLGFVDQANLLKISGQFFIMEFGFNR